MTGDVLGIHLDDGTRDALREALARTGDELRDVDEATLEDVLQREPLDVVLVGTRADSPIRAAQRVFAFDPRLPVLLLTEPEWHDELCRALQVAPFVSTAVRCLAASDREALVSALREAAEQARKSREHRRTLDALNARLAEASAGPAPPAVFDSLLEHAPIGVVVADASGAVRGCNRKASGILERSERSALGVPLADVLGAEDAARWRELVSPLLEGTGASFREVFRHVGRTGATRHVEVTAASLRPYGGPAGTLLILQDVSERVEMMEELQRSLVARDEFISIAAHELRTPITSLLLNVQGIVRPRDPADAARVLQTRGRALERSATRLAGLVENLLDVSRIQEGRLEIAREPVDLSEVVREVTQRYAHDCERAGCTLRVEIEEGIVGMWDRVRLDQITTNLLFNAIKYGAGHPVEVRVAADRQAGRAVLTVRDHGIGIPEEQQERIFGRFERAVSVRTYGGFGLGLWIVRQIVEALGGTVRLHSRLEQGATFLVELPLPSNPPAP